MPPPAPDSGDAPAPTAAASRPAHGNGHGSTSSTGGDGGGGPLDIEDVLYSAKSFWAVLKPVALTMFLAALVVVNVDFVSDDQGMSVYTINTAGSGDGDDDGSGGGGDSTTVKLGKSLANALTIVGVICAATFVVVLLYKFRCMKASGIPSCR